ncbi:hypothetical protein [Helicobacter bilis]|nr:hypothetical protein [Helicobacter bilis]
MSAKILAKNINKLIFMRYVGKAKFLEYDLICYMYVKQNKTFVNLKLDSI